MPRCLAGYASLSMASVASLLAVAPAHATALLVPAYFEDPTLWNQLTAVAAKGVPVTAILNPNSGPGTSVDPTLLADVTGFEAAGGTVVGYVHTTGDKRAIGDVETDIQNYESFYPIDGIFVDEMSSGTKAAQINYYSALYSYIKGQNSSYEVIGNPGDTVPSQYESLADTLVTFEDVNANYASNTPAAWTATANPNQTANIIYETAGAAAMLADVAEAQSQNVGYVYVTDDGADGNPYDSLPSYFSAEASAVPEPGSVAMIGATGLLLRRRRSM